MKTWRTVLVLGLLTTSAGAWAQTGGQGTGTSGSGSPDIYNTGKTGSKTLPPEGTKTSNTGVAENPLKNTLQGIYNRCVAATKNEMNPYWRLLTQQETMDGKPYDPSTTNSNNRNNSQNN